MKSSTGLGLEAAHSVILVKDGERMVEFYRDVLGFEVADRGSLDGIAPVPPGTELIFMSQHANHHHQVAFMTQLGTTDASNNYHHSAYRSTTGTLDDLRTLLTRLQAQPDVTGIMPLNHGNAWSIYFQDPENNGVEVFIDSPYHVIQPAGVPLDLSLSDAEIAAATVAAYKDKPEFGDLGEFYAKRAEHLSNR